MKKTALPLLLGLLVAHPAMGQDVRVFPNVRIYPGQMTQTEPVVAVHPTDPLRLFASAVTINTNGGFTSEGVYVTTNGGLSWSGSDTCTGAAINSHGRDPWVGITSTGRLILTHQSPVFSGVFSHYSDNSGISWTSAATITSQQTDDKGTSGIDNLPTSPYYGRMYSAWAPVAALASISVAFTSNSGQSWTQAVVVNPSPPLRCIGGFIKTGLAGEVYVAWAGVQSTTPFNEDIAGFAVSTNGGVNWRVSQTAFDMNGIFGTLPTKSNIRVNGLPHFDIDKSTGPRRGWIFMVTAEKNLAPAGSDPDIVLHRSTDDGLTWSSGIRVNQDAPNNGRTQYFPAINVDANGGINIIYYDDRNTALDSAEVMLARSLDGGSTWRDYTISDHRFKPKPIAGGASNYQGDHISVTSVGTTLYPFWMDDYSGLYQIWSTRIDLPTLDTDVEDNAGPTLFELKQNYPNPFNPSTTIEYTLARRAFVDIRIFDVTGKTVARPVASTQEPGSHRIVFDADVHHLASGIYYCQVVAGEFRTVKPMVLIR
jgi:hypothetical protein